MNNGMRVVIMIFALRLAALGQTYSETVLYSFGSSFADGYYPNGGVVVDSEGNIYGTTTAGGGWCEPGGCGIVFKLSPSGTETILHRFRGLNAQDGAYPYASLTLDKSGNLYGTTVYGGLGPGNGLGYGYGTVFKITSTGKYSILHKFGGALGDGLNPYGPLTLDGAGNLYGVTIAGGSLSGACGAGGCGTIFRVSPRGAETIVYAFSPDVNAGFPAGNVLRDAKGNLFGIGNNVLFEVSPGGIESELYNFNNLGITNFATDNYLTWDSSGNFYGAFEIRNDIPNPGIWQVTSQGGIETNSYFSQKPLEQWDLTGALMFSGGLLYGTTQLGGADLCGEVYEFEPTTGTETVLYSLTCEPDGEFPAGGVTMDAVGNLYGTASKGGDTFYDIGAVFKLTKND